MVAALGTATGLPPAPGDSRGEGARSDADAALLCGAELQKQSVTCEVDVSLKPTSLTPLTDPEQPSRGPLLPSFPRGQGCGLELDDRDRATASASGVGVSCFPSGRDCVAPCPSFTVPGKSCAYRAWFKYSSPARLPSGTRPRRFIRPPGELPAAQPDRSASLWLIGDQNPPPPVLPSLQGCGCCGELYAERTLSRLSTSALGTPCLLLQSASRKWGASEGANWVLTPAGCRLLRAVVVFASQGHHNEVPEKRL